MPDESSVKRRSSLAGKPSSGETVGDLAVAGMAFQIARFGRKLFCADADGELYRARMNRLADAAAAAAWGRGDRRGW